MCVRPGCVGTTHYMCPELFQDAPYTTAVDMFATGVLLFNLLSGTQPFDASGGSRSGYMCIALRLKVYQFRLHTNHQVNMALVF